MTSPAHIARLDQLTAAFRDLAEALAVFRAQLVKAGFTEDGAESICEMFLVEWLHVD